MDALGENSFDTVIACDVLEHVPDDLKAMRELQRILSPDGVAVLTVPQADDLTVKVELPPDASAADRLRLAGQEDHQCIYGKTSQGCCSKLASTLRRWTNPVSARALSNGIVFDRRFIRRIHLLPITEKCISLASRWRNSGSRIAQASSQYSFYFEAHQRPEQLRDSSQIGLA